MKYFKKIDYILFNLQKLFLYGREYLKVLCFHQVNLFFDGFNYKTNKKLAICIGFSEWKRDYIKEYLPEYSLSFTNHRTPTWKLIKLFEDIDQAYEVLIWSYKDNNKLTKYFKSNNIPITRVEDGFIRSCGLGLHETKPLSLVFDKRGLYFNTSSLSDLEYIIQNKALNYTIKQLDVAKALIYKITSKGISKYNFRKKIEKVEYLPKDKKIVLVIGQVEDDMSIKYGCSNPITNLSLLQSARNEHDNAYIIYKPHPDTLTGIRKTISPLNECEKLCNVVDITFNLDTLIKVAEHVYTITSLSGFEALMYGKKVTCFGSPFYSGYGLTDDRDIRDHNINNKLSLEQLFYASYIEYPRYIRGDINSTINFIEEGLRENV